MAADGFDNRTNGSITTSRDDEIHAAGESFSGHFLANVIDGCLEPKAFCIASGGSFPVDGLP